MLSMRVLALALVAATAQAWDLNCSNGPCQLKDASGTAVPTTNSAALSSFTAQATSTSGPSGNAAAAPQVTGMAGAVAGAVFVAALAL